MRRFRSEKRRTASDLHRRGARAGARDPTTTSLANLLMISRGEPAEEPASLPGPGPAGVPCSGWPRRHLASQQGAQWAQVTLELGRLRPAMLDFLPHRKRARLQRLHDATQTRGSPPRTLQRVRRVLLQPRRHESHSQQRRVQRRTVQKEDDWPGCRSVRLLLSLAAARTPRSGCACAPSPREGFPLRLI